MIFFRYSRLQLCSLSLAFAALANGHAVQPDPRFPAPEKLTYDVEWRLVNAGSATVQLSRSGASKGWEFKVSIASAGLVSRLYRILDTYNVITTDQLCVSSARLDAQEGKRHSVSTFVADNFRRKLTYDDHDLVKNQTEKKELDIAPCTYEILGALAALRTLNVAPGKSIPIAITDGKKFAQARIEAQAVETVSAGGKTYHTTRYEAFLFDNVLYKRRGRLLIWINDAPDHVPVQFRLLLGFPIGTITVELQKQEK